MHTYVSAHSPTSACTHNTQVLATFPLYTPLPDSRRASAIGVGSAPACLELVSLSILILDPACLALPYLPAHTSASR